MTSNWSDLLRVRAAAVADLAPPATPPEPVEPAKPIAPEPHGWPADYPVGPIPDFNRPGEEQGLVILDVFGRKVAVPLASLERLIAYNRGCPKSKPTAAPPKKIAPGLFDEEQ